MTDFTNSDGPLAMAMAFPSISIYLDKRWKKEDERNPLYPVKLRVYFRGQTRFYNTGLSLSETDFQCSFMVAKPKGKTLQELQIKLQSLLSRANEVKDKIDRFSFERFERKFLRPSGSGKDVLFYYTEIIEQFKSEERLGTALSYDTSQKSLKKFLVSTGKSDTKLNFYSITVPFLKEYEKWMLKSEKSVSTVGIYLRPLRTIFNLAIKEGEIDDDVYPFGKGKYQIPASRNIKKALKKEELKMLFEYDASGDCFIEKARDFWFFSYCANGMNIKDIVELKWKNISENTLHFVRSKTKHMVVGNQVPIMVSLNDFSKKVIEKYGTNKRKKDDYVFAVLHQEMTADEKHRAVKAFTRFINQHIKRLAKKLGLPDSLSTYWARHSFTTTAVRNGASLELIQESLGHTSVATTMNYWGGFEDNAKKEIADKLLNF